MKFSHKRLTFRIGLSTLVILTVLAISASSLWNVHRLSSRVAMETAKQLFGEISEKVSERIDLGFTSVRVLADSAASVPSLAAEPVGDGLNHSGLHFLFSTLDHHPATVSVYLGYQSGAFLQVVAPRANPFVLKGYGAPPRTKYAVRAISRDSSGKLRQHWTYLDEQRRVIDARSEDDPGYDPRRRPWYTQSLGSDKSRFTEPYIFDILKVPGFTCSRKLMDHEAVFGLDFTMSSISDYLEKQRISAHGGLFIFDKNLNLIAHPHEDVVEKNVPGPESSAKTSFLPMSDSSDPNVKAMSRYLAQAGKGFPEGIFRISASGQVYLAKITGMSPQAEFSESLGIIAPFGDFTDHIRQMQIQNTLLSLAVLIVAIPLALWASARMSKSLTLLSRATQKVQQFDFSPTEPIDSVIKEINSLVTSFDLMKKEIRQRTDALIDTQGKLEILVERGISLSAERDVSRLLEMIFLAAKVLSQADGGILYLREKDERGDRLQVKIVRNDARGVNLGGDSGQPVPEYYLPVHDPEDQAGHGHIAIKTLFTEKTILIDNISDSEDQQLLEACMDNVELTCRAESILSTPLRTRQGEVIGVLLLMDARDPEAGTVGPFQGEFVRFVEALAAQAAVALDNNNLLIAQQNLMDSLIELIAGAIDAKSPYTGGHCQRVPVIASLLAKAAHESREEPFKDFGFQTDEKWKEFRTAAWLHDCGKVTTPEYVVDKATKLETLYNRIHEIRTRFEVLWRDAEIEYWQKKAEGLEDEARLEKRLQEAREKIKNDFAFVAECNIGGEFMSEDRVDRLAQIGRQTWQRNLDDRWGMSNDEISRRKKTPSGDPPVREFLLADKPEHIITRKSGLSHDPDEYGFKMDIPEHQYNLGELYNLGIRKGTLTAEERFIINEHIIQSTIMLENLPFPRHMEQVPEIALAHHETMIGTGYPRRLTREDMSIPARIMAIADIFEALTASDRPYKKAKTLSESLKIMSFMRNDRHIDAELFHLFLKSGAWLTYAREYLDPSQIDEIDVEKLLARTS